MKPLLSIAIPVFNQDVKKLVYSLQNQINELEAPIEILVFDDGSSLSWKKKNQSLTNLPGTEYSELPANVGRAAIRNRLARAARAAHILFLDGDSVIIEKNFLKSYLKEISNHPEAVICGGRKYPGKCPANEYSLHWHYGRYRESKSAAIRSLNPYEGFHSNNFIMPVSVWQQTPFDESLKQYGHEDTLLGYELMLRGSEVQHIENPTIHGQLENNREFLHKTRQAIQNLKLLYDRGDDQFIQWHRLLRRYEKLKKMKLQFAGAMAYKIMHRFWEGRLSQSEEPSLREFNWYRFSYLCSL
jgi:glycosyltransferase involved in cell wall biosynthesis